MNISVDRQRALDLPVTVVADVIYLSVEHACALLGLWSDRPSRSWALVSNRLVIAHAEGFDPAITMTEVPDEDGFVSLPALARATNNLNWGEALGDPSPEQQIALLASLDSRLSLGGMPRDRAALVNLVMQVVGEAIR